MTIISMLLFEGAKITDRRVLRRGTASQNLRVLLSAPVVLLSATWSTGTASRPSAWARPVRDRSLETRKARQLPVVSDNDGVKINTETRMAANLASTRRFHGRRSGGWLIFDLCPTSGPRQNHSSASPASRTCGDKSNMDAHGLTITTNAVHYH
jgi:hypothetical protein